MTRKVLSILLIGMFTLTACGSGEADATPTLDANLIQTQAIGTFSAALTQTAFAAPTQTPPSTPTMLPTFEPLATSPIITLPAATFPAAAASPTASCYQLRFISDVTVPDNTQMAPGQSFTKTWKVKNVGTCAWDAGFKFAFVGGDQMNGATYTLPSSVAANAEVDISIAMIAPINKTGSVRGNWRMQTAGGTYFGDEVYVLIIVGGATLTPTKATPTNTSAPPASTATATPETPTATATPLNP
ncbi:MAG: hypothetical protein HXY42_13985 [Chloroflexi bacterium]|nr:hypothetical protein [Chloroflexota bacterium]